MSSIPSVKELLVGEIKHLREEVRLLNTKCNTLQQYVDSVKIQNDRDIVAIREGLQRCKCRYDKCGNCGACGYFV